MDQIRHWGNVMRTFRVVMLVLFATGMAMTTANPPLKEVSDAARLLNETGMVSPQQPQRLTGLASLPLSFVPNVGQLNWQVLYQARGLAGDLYFTSQGIIFALSVTAAS